MSEPYSKSLVVEVPDLQYVGAQAHDKVSPD
jgi:hypothetical protein